MVFVASDNVQRIIARLSSIVRVIPPAAWVVLALIIAVQGEESWRRVVLPPRILTPSSLASRDEAFVRDWNAFEAEWRRANWRIALESSALLAVVLACAWLSHRRRRWEQRRARGLCADCGYDLRGSSGGRCPECGAAAAFPPIPPHNQPLQRTGDAVG